MSDYSKSSCVQDKIEQMSGREILYSKLGNARAVSGLESMRFSGMQFMCLLHVCTFFSVSSGHCQ